jgi:uncharacterized protein YbjQ (UPF0145 family)
VSGRLRRLAEQKISTGLLSVPDSAALASVGFESVTEVIGAVANNVSPGGFVGLGIRTWSDSTTWNQTRTSSSHNARFATPATLTALKTGYRIALSRLAAEAVAARADGVIGVTMKRSVTHGNGAQLWSFLAVGTAVRSIGSTHTQSPFTTDFSGTEFAASVRGGLLPLSLLIVPCMAIRWIDPQSRVQRKRLAVNGEIDAYTDLINTCRHQARQDFAAAARNVRADAAVLSDMTLGFEIDSPEPVCTASVTVTGTALTEFQLRTQGRNTLTIMPLGRAAR